MASSSATLPGRLGRLLLSQHAASSCSQAPLGWALRSSASQHSRFSRRSVSYDSTLRSVATQLATAAKAEIQMNPPRLVLSRLTELEDTQLYGLVHGCTQLQLVEDAGTTLTTKYCNKFAPPNSEVRTMSGCLERVDFLKPMLVGDIAEVEAEITYTTPRSLQVTASVYAKNTDDGSRYKTAEAKTWFVAKTVGDDPKSAPVPPLTSSDGSKVHRPDSEAGYLAMKQHRDRIRPDLYDRPYRPNVIDFYAKAEAIEPQTIDFSRISFTLPIQPNHCVPGENYCRGGVILRLMDETGSLVGVSHTNQYSFTANFDAVLFHRPVHVGTVAITHAKAIFSSAKTLEVAIKVDEQRLIPGKGMRTARVADGILTFMTIDPNTARSRPIPPLKLVKEEERKLFEIRRELYEQRKLARQMSS